MIKILIHVGVGTLLFVGALLGGLAATGRLNHEGTANLPLLSSLFPAPPAAPEAHGGEGGGQTGAADAGHSGGAGQPADASAAGEPQGDEVPRRQKEGRSVEKPEAKPAEGGHGEAPAADHGGGKDGGAKDGGHGAAKDKDKGDTGKAKAGEAAGGHAAERDFAQRRELLADDRRNKYTPGGYFTFEGMPAGLSPEQINDAWQRVQGVLADLEQRKAVLDQREKDLQILADDIDLRRRKVAEKLLEIETEGKKLDARIAKFQEQVKLVRIDEVAALKRNAQTYASFEPTRTAELIGELWRTEKGQEEVLKTLEFMDKDGVNRILEALPNPTVQEVLRKRLRISREQAPAAGPGK
jgi:hypothetical protein